MSNSVKRKAADLAAADAKKPKANASITSFFGAPKSAANGNVNSGTAQTPAIKFDKEKWVSKLTEEQKDLLKLEIQTLHESWLAHLKDEVVTEKFLSLKRFLKKEREDGKTIYPPLGDIYSWLVLQDYQRAASLSNAAILGPDILLFTQSKPSSLVKTHTIMLTKHTVSASPSARLRLLHPH